MGCLLLISGHVTLQFKDKLYLIGGRSSDIQSYNLENTERNADVWYTADGGTCYYSFQSKQDKGFEIPSKRRPETTRWLVDP